MNFESEYLEFKQIVKTLENKQIESQIINLMRPEVLSFYDEVLKNINYLEVIDDE